MRLRPSSSARQQEQAIMSDFIFVGLGVVLFVVIAAYARLCARL
jgi:hypothetical protein